MNTVFMKSARSFTIAIALAASASIAAQTSQATDDSNTTSVADGVVAILDARMAEAPSARIPLLLRHEARCTAIFPSVIKAGLIVAGKRGKGVVSCRNHDTGAWGPPLYYNMTEASIGLQAGIQNASIVLLIVDDKGLKHLLDEKLSFGGDVSVAAGTLGAGKQVNIDTSVVSYARSEGVFAGMQLGSSAVTFDKAATAKAYGEELDPADVLFSELTVPAELIRVQEALTKFAPPKS
jgi:lipid-binding SYLF domain-containing protein